MHRTPHLINKPSHTLLSFPPSISTTSRTTSPIKEKPKDVAVIMLDKYINPVKTHYNNYFEAYVKLINGFQRGSIHSVGLYLNLVADTLDKYISTCRVLRRKMQKIGFNNLMDIVRTHDIIKVVTMTETIYEQLFELERYNMPEPHRKLLTKYVECFEKLSDAVNIWMDKFFY